MNILDIGIAIGAAVKQAFGKSKDYTDAAISALPKGVIYKGEVNTIADLPTPSQSNVGWMYSVIANNHDYVSTGTAWHDQDLNNYQKPETGIPKTDLDEDVRSSLDKADSAASEDWVEGYAYSKEEADAKEENLVTYIDSSDTTIFEYLNEHKVEKASDSDNFKMGVDSTGIFYEAQGETE